MADVAGIAQGVQNAQQYLQSILQQYGLGDLSGWAYGEIANGASMDQVMVDMQQQPSFKKRFPGMDALRAAGLSVPTPAEYLQVEKGYKETMKSYGIAPSTNPSDYVGLMTGQVSANEFDQRMAQYHRLNSTYGPSLKAGFEQIAGISGVTDSDLYKLLSGQDPSLAQKYAKATGTQQHNLSFADLQTIEEQAKSQYEAGFKSGGEVQTGISESEAASQLSAKALALPGLQTGPSPTPATNKSPAPTGAP